jgi:histidinol phosphatase-like enzyme
MRLEQEQILPPVFPRTKAVAPTLIFDFDGTIADDTLPAIIRMVHGHADEWNILPLVEDDVEALRRMTSREIIKK